jgi:5-methyltetrahydrofolate corrinoid/iron sulfur protein methyltransferase
MIIVGEKLNGMFSSVSKAIDERNPETIVKLATDQINAGAHILDVSVGPGRDDAIDAMKWMVRTIQDAVDTRLSIDSPSSEVIRAGISECKRTPLINSTTAEDAKLTELLSLAKEYSAEIVCLTIDEKGIPNSVEMRTELAMKILAFAMDIGVPVESIYIDPVVLPVSAAQNQLALACEALSAFKTLSSPPPKTIVGLSNVSSGAQEKKLLNRTLLAMMMGRGLDAAILDPLDVELMNTMKAAEVLLNKRLYAHSFLKA